ncbi:MAG: peptide chain release factor 1 [Deltaproteobacteria bacterium]|nr:peptide chain release factor 1 [Deltaproteobacteria bacterium]
MSDLSDRLSEIEARARALEQRLSDPGLASQPGEYAKVGKQLGSLRPLLEAARRWRQTVSELDDARLLLHEADAELRELAGTEIERLGAERDALEVRIKELLLPKDPNDDKDVILEIRAGTGGDEAALFAADLFRMYSRHAETMGWKVEPLSLSDGAAGGMKEVIASISGDRVWSRMKYERGVHRVQRVPATESAGRIHTSTATVAVLPEAEEVEIQIDPKDLRIDVFRSSGPGGQSVNTTDSAVRVTHLPTGEVVQCQDEKSQHKNKARALKILRARLLEAEQERQAAARASEKKSQVGTGDRSEKIRTYNFPQSRITDHRVGVTVHRLAEVLEGDLGPLLDAVHAEFQKQAEQEALAS